MSRTVWISIIVVVLLLGVGGWFIAKNQSAKAPSQETSAQQTQVPAPTVEATPMQEMEASPSGSPAASGKPVSVSGSEFKFTPATLTAKVGQPVTVTFTNNG